MLSQDELLSHPAIAVHCNSTLDYFVNQEGVKPITADPSSFPTEGGLIAALIPSIQVYQVHFFALPKFEAGQLSLEQVTRKIGKETLTRAYSFPVSEHMVTRLNQDVLAPFE